MLEKLRESLINKRETNIVVQLRRTQYDFRIVQRGDRYTIFNLDGFMYPNMKLNWEEEGLEEALDFLKTLKIVKIK